jgi:hypothetical protein
MERCAETSGAEAQFLRSAMSELKLRPPQERARRRSERREIPRCTDFARKYELMWEAREGAGHVETRNAPGFKEPPRRVVGRI